VALDAQRLGRVLGLLSSSHDGEVLNAARAADRIVKEAGLTWLDVAQRIGVSTRPTGYQAASPEPAPRTQRTYKRAARPAAAPKKTSTSHKGIQASELIAYLLNPVIHAKLNGFERSFVMSVDGQSRAGRGLSENQWRVLWECGQKVRAIIEPFAA
jgi:hypothetical protein